MKVQDYIYVLILLLLLIIAFFMAKKMQAFDNIFKKDTKITEPQRKTFTSATDTNESKNDTPKKKKMKHKHIRIVKIFNDEIPRSVDTLLVEYNKLHKEISKTEVKYLLKWLEKEAYLQYEDTEDLGFIYGTPELFEEDGNLKEESLKKINSYNEIRAEAI